jgi:hypothetical protein
MRNLIKHIVQLFSRIIMANDQLNAALTEAVVANALGKKWYESKTVWANIVAGLTVAGQMKYGFIVSPEVQMLVMSALNLALRKITKDPIVW